MKIGHIDMLLAAYDTTIACAHVHMLLGNIAIGLLLKAVLGSITVMGKRTLLLLSTLRWRWSQIRAESVALPLFRY